MERKYMTRKGKVGEGNARNDKTWQGKTKKYMEKKGMERNNTRQGMVSQNMERKVNTWRVKDMERKGKVWK